MAVLRPANVRPQYFEQHSGWYRPILDLSAPWVDSPVFDEPKMQPDMFFPLDEPSEHRGGSTKIGPTVIEASIVSSSKTPASRRYSRKRLQLALFLHKLADKIGGRTHATIDSTSVEKYNPGQKHGRRPPKDVVPLREWKQFGYFARPKLHGVSVINYPPKRNIPKSMNVEQVFMNLLDENGKVRKDRWIPGLEHPAIPPCPERWKYPPKRGPQPFPCQCQLNPLLQHIRFGKSVLEWDISQDPTHSIFARANPIIPLLDPDFAQPATYPFVTHMYIHSIAEYPYPEDNWPFFVINHNGVTVGDVLRQIYRNFKEYLGWDEYMSWNERKYRLQEAVDVGFAASRGRDFALRLHSLGTHHMFRGLEAHPNNEGWAMFLGLA